MTKTREFTHFKLNEEVKSISGHMAFREEKRLQFDNREILFYTGYSVTDSSCCGMGACLFTYVPGYISRWHIKLNDEGDPVSEIEPVIDEDIRKKITRQIMGNETCSQVNFMDE